MIKLAEHRWGLNGVSDTSHWSNKEFYKVRERVSFQNAKNSWMEQKAFVNFILEALGDHPQAQMMCDELETKAKETAMDSQFQILLLLITLRCMHNLILLLDLFLHYRILTLGNGYLKVHILGR